MPNVSVNRSVLIAILAVAAASLLGLSFVLGRMSQPSAEPSRLAGFSRPGGRAKDTPPPPPTASAASTTELLESRAVSVPPPATSLQIPQTDATPTAPTPAAERRVAASDPERAAVAAYFDAVERIPSTMSGEAESVANEMAAALSRGDTSGLDKLIRETETAKSSLAAVSPPAPCATFHRESLASLDDALEVLRSMKAAMESSDPVTGLSRVSARANSLQARADAVKREERALRERYDLRR